jgi:hemerythrin
MAFMEWNESYSVKVAEIDVQHKHLIDLINRLFEAMSVGKGSEVMGSILNDLIDYTKNHFANEEKLMKSFNYPQSVTHKLEHDTLTNQVIDLQGEFASGKSMISVKVMNFLKDWLKNHILQVDKKFGEFLNSVGKH